MAPGTQLVSPHFVLQLCFFSFFSFSLLWRPQFFLEESKGKGDLQIAVNHPSFGAVPIALVNETVAMGVAICVDPIAAAATAPDILALQTGLLCTPYTNGVIVARRREHVGICRIPAYTIDCARVTSQSLDEIPGGSMPYVDLKI